jgi:hypothetical protein
MGAAKNRADNGLTDYFPSTLFSREAPGAIEMEYVTAHEVGHALANILLDYPIEFTSVTSHLDNRIEGFTKTPMKANQPPRSPCADTIERGRCN